MPLIVLVSVYSIAMVGMTLIPGMDEQGNTVHMSFFHAFYFVSYMGTTIGFGEIPHPFTDQQRMWVVACIYVSVISWLYAIGNLLSLLQDPTFRRAVANRIFSRSVKRITRDFYVICGYGDTGRLITRGLAELNIQTVIVDHNPDNIGSIELSELAPPPITLCGDITHPSVLEDAGITSPLCKGVIAVTQIDHTNLNIAVAVKLINPNTKVICRSEIEDEAANMTSFGTDFTVNPFHLFSKRLEQLTDNHSKHRLHSWLVNQHSKENINLEIAINGLPQGPWIVCGYGRLGRSIYQILKKLNVEVQIIEIDPEATNAPPNTIQGRGTEAATLRQAGIAQAKVVVAGTNDDANNLSILITARELNAQIYTIGRVNDEAKHSLYNHVKCDYVMRKSQLVSNAVLTILSRPLVSRFLDAIDKHPTQEQIPDLIKAIDSMVQHHTLVTSRLILTEEHSPALIKLLAQGNTLRVKDVLRPYKDSAPREIALFLARAKSNHDGNNPSFETHIVLPSLDDQLLVNDQLLVCHPKNRRSLALELAGNYELVDTLVVGNKHYIPLLRWASRQRRDQKLDINVTPER